MASINNILRGYLNTKSSVYSLIGGTGSGSSTARILPEGQDLNDVQFPYLTIEQIIDEEYYHLTGSSNIKTVTVEIHAKGKTNQEAENLAEQVRLVLSGLRGDANGTFIKKCHKTDYEIDIQDRRVGDDKSLFTHTTTFDITLDIATPTL